MGLFDTFTEGLFGGGDPGSSGAFPIGDLGGAMNEYLMQKLRTPAKDSTQFALGSQAIRDGISAQTATARQRFGDRATTGGFLDSGAVTSGMMDIDRAGTASYASSIRELLLGLEDRRAVGVLPFLQGASQEHMQRAQIDQQSANASMGFINDFISYTPGT